MAKTIFEDLHKRLMTSQCEECRANGWPMGWFDCAGDNIDCADYRPF